MNYCQLAPVRGHDILCDMPDPWKPVDPLGEALHFLRMSGVFYCRCEFSAPWGLDLPPFGDCMMFHVVTGGECWLEVDGAEPCHLRQGDFALVPHGAGHRLAARSATRPASCSTCRGSC